MSTSDSSDDKRFARFRRTLREIARQVKQEAKAAATGIGARTAMAIGIVVLVAAGAPVALLSGLPLTIRTLIESLRKTTKTESQYASDLLDGLSPPEEFLGAITHEAIETMSSIFHDAVKEWHLLKEIDVRVAEPILEEIESIRIEIIEELAKKDAKESLDFRKKINVIIESMSGLLDETKRITERVDEGNRLLLRILRDRSFRPIIEYRQRHLDLATKLIWDRVMYYWAERLRKSIADETKTTENCIQIEGPPLSGKSHVAQIVYQEMLEEFLDSHRNQDGVNSRAPFYLFLEGLPSGIALGASPFHGMMQNLRVILDTQARALTGYEFDIVKNNGIILFLDFKEPSDYERILFELGLGDIQDMRLIIISRNREMELESGSSIGICNLHEFASSFVTFIFTSELERSKIEGCDWATAQRIAKELETLFLQFGELMTLPLLAKIRSALIDMWKSVVNGSEVSHSKMIQIAIQSWSDLIWSSHKGLVDIPLRWRFDNYVYPGEGEDWVTASPRPMRVVPSAQDFCHGLVVDFPNQNALSEALNMEKTSLILGASGTGKTTIATRALFNNWKNGNPSIMIRTDTPLEQWTPHEKIPEILRRPFLSMVVFLDDVNLLERPYDIVSVTGERDFSTRRDKKLILALRSEAVERLQDIFGWPSHVNLTELRNKSEALSLFEIDKEKYHSQIGSNILAAITQNAAPDELIEGVLTETEHNLALLRFYVEPYWRLGRTDLSLFQENLCSAVSLYVECLAREARQSTSLNGITRYHIGAVLTVVSPFASEELHVWRNFVLDNAKLKERLGDQLQVIVDWLRKRGELRVRKSMGQEYYSFAHAQMGNAYIAQLECPGELAFMTGIGPDVFKASTILEYVKGISKLAEYDPKEPMRFLTQLVSIPASIARPIVTDGEVKEVLTSVAKEARQVSSLLRKLMWISKDSARNLLAETRGIVKREIQDSNARDVGIILHTIHTIDDEIAENLIEEDEVIECISKVLDDATPKEAESLFVVLNAIDMECARNLIHKKSLNLFSQYRSDRFSLKDRDSLRKTIDWILGESLRWKPRELETAAKIVEIIGFIEPAFRVASDLHVNGFNLALKWLNAKRESGVLSLTRTRAYALRFNVLHWIEQARSVIKVDKYAEIANWPFPQKKAERDQILAIIHDCLSALASESEFAFSEALDKYRRNMVRQSLRFAGSELKGVVAARLLDLSYSDIQKQIEEGDFRTVLQAMDNCDFSDLYAIYGVLSLKDYTLNRIWDSLEVLDTTITNIRPVLDGRFDMLFRLLVDENKILDCELDDKRTIETLSYILQNTRFIPIGDLIVMLYPLLKHSSGNLRIMVGSIVGWPYIRRSLHIEVDRIIPLFRLLKEHIKSMAPFEWNNRQIKDPVYFLNTEWGNLKLFRLIEEEHVKDVVSLIKGKTPFNGDNLYD